MRDTLEAVIARVPVAVRKPAEFQRVLKLDRSLSSRLLRAVQLNDPLASLHRMPGPHGVRLLLNAARKKQVDEKLIARAERALGELENLVTTEIGDWQDLSVAISGWLPDAREPFDMGNRQIVFKAMSNIKGICDPRADSEHGSRPASLPAGLLLRASQQRTPTISASSGIMGSIRSTFATRCC